MNHLDVAELNFFVTEPKNISYKQKRLRTKNMAERMVSQPKGDLNLWLLKSDIFFLEIPGMILLMAEILHQLM